MPAVSDVDGLLELSASLTHRAMAGCAGVFPVVLECFLQDTLMWGRVAL